jgi:branched-chain amino acid aminotransferase
MSRVVFFNGQFVPESEARVSIFDSALMYGDMAFEMTRTFGHRPFRLRDHLDRLYGSLRLLEIDSGLSVDEMMQVTADVLEKNIPTEAADVDWQIMHNISRGPLSLYETVFPGGIQPTVSINCWPLVTHMGSFASKYEAGVELMIPAQQTLPAHIVDLKAKTRSRLHYRMAELQAARSGVGRLPLLLDPHGFLAEGTGWNVFLVKDGVIFTPEPRNILQGVSRGVTISLANELGIELRETNLGRYEALMADEMFCTATSFSLVHAATFEGQTVGDGQAGPVFHKLLGAWKEHVGIDFVAQAHGYAARLDAWREHDAERPATS